MELNYEDNNRNKTELKGQTITFLKIVLIQKILDDITLLAIQLIEVKRRDVIQLLGLSLQ